MKEEKCMKKGDRIQSAIVLLLAAALLFGLLGILMLRLNGNAAEELQPVYRLEFADEADRGKNTADSGIASAQIVDGGGISYAEQDVKGNTALTMTSAGNHANYVAIPGEVLNSQSVTIAGWFQIDSAIPDFARMLEINNGKNGTGEYSWLSVMPYAPNFYNGLHINCGIETVVKLGVDNADNMMFEGGDPSAAVNTPQASYILPVYDAWTHYAYELTPDGFSLYQNGKLLKTVEGDFTASQFYSDAAKIYLGATFHDGTMDFTGGFSDIRIYQTALSEEQIAEEYALTYNDFLTTEYTFEDGAKDGIRGYDGTLIGNAKIEQDTQTGSNVLVLDGTNAGDGNETKTSMEIPLKTLHGHNAVTVSADVFIDSDCSNYARIFDFSRVAAQSFSLGAKWGNATALRLKFTKNEAVQDQMVDTNTEFNRWVNITVTLDGSNAAIYLDGLLAAESNQFEYKNSMFWEAVGTFAFGRTQFWNDNPMKGKLDNIKIYQTALTEREVMMEAGVTTIEDDVQAVAQEKEKLQLDWDGTASKIDLPAYAGEGVKLSWKSSNPEVITDEGSVFIPQIATEVTLTATLSRGDAQDIKSFVLTVQPREIVDPSVVFGTALDAAGFEKDSYWYGLMETNLDYMFSLNADRLLYNYRRIAGLDTRGVSSYGAWISPTGNGAGQFEAHYVVALVKAALTMPEYEYNGESVLDRLTYMLTEMQKCQEAYAQKDPENAGYFSAIIVDNFDALEEGRTILEDGTTRWVPWYFYHKNLEALLDVYTYAPDASLREIAYDMLCKASDWVYKRMSSIDETIRQRVLTVEYGGMAEVLYQTYRVTKDPDHFKAAQYFEEKSFLDNVYKNIDLLNGLHANTTIPKILGCAAAYEVTGDEYYKTICINGFDMIMTRTYANGSTSKGEFWQEAGHTKEGTDTAETCCSYNMLKLADYLYRWTGDVKYADYFENVYTNHILASMAPDTGLKTYLTNSAFGYYKVYHTPDNSFWCCACTGMESFAKLPYGIYYTAEDELRVNMFYPSTVRLDENVTVMQSGNFFTEQKTVLTVNGNGTFTLALRLPDWAENGAALTVNGEPLRVTASDGYFEITREWQDGDRIEYSVPFSFRLEQLKGSDGEYAIMYGPMLLVADLGTEDVNDVQENQTTFGSAYTGNITNKLVLSGKTLEESADVVSDAEGNLFVTLHTLNQGDLMFRPFNQLFHSRYGTYFMFYDSVQEAEEDYTIVGNEFGNAFDDQSSLSMFTQYTSTGDRAKVENGQLVTPASGEIKLLAGLSLSAPYVIEASISAASENGAINGGIYLWAGNADNGQDLIKAYNVQIERDAGAGSYLLSIFRFDRAYLGLVSQVQMTMPESGVIDLHILVQEDTCSVFVNGSKMPALTFAIDSAFITEETGDIGIRSQVSSFRIDDFRVISAQLPVGKQMLDSALSVADGLDAAQFTPSTAETYRQALAAAKAVSQDAEATQTEVNQANERLRSAMASLERLGDPTALMNAVRAANLLDERNYTAASWAGLQQVLDQIKDSDLSVMSEQEIAALESRMTQALFGLTEDRQGGQLAGLIASAEALKAEDYTQESWKAFEKVLNEVKALGELSAAQEDAACIRLLQAQTGLVKISDGSTGTDGDSDATAPEENPDGNGLEIAAITIGAVAIAAVLAWALVLIIRRKKNRQAE